LWGATTTAAEAANLNAEAIMAAEVAHLYPIIQSDNLKKDVFFRIIHYENTGKDSDYSGIPEVVYRIKNYGKTPAVLQRLMHGMEFFKKPSTTRLMHQEDERPLEILGAGQESENISYKMHATFNRGMAKAVHEYDSELMFFGEVIFTDFFGRQMKCIWECDGRSGGFKLTRHEQRPAPDEKI